MIPNYHDSHRLEPFCQRGLTTVLSLWVLLKAQKRNMTEVTALGVRRFYILRKHKNDTELQYIVIKRVGMTISLFFVVETRKPYLSATGIQ